MAANTVYALVQTMVYVDGGGKNCVIAIIVQLAVNFFASIILGLKFGMTGIAFGTVIGYLAAMAVFAKWIFIDSQTLKPICYFSLSDTVKVLKYSYVHASLYLHIGLVSLATGISGIWLGIAAVSIVSVLLFALFLRIRYPKNFPLLLPLSDIVSRDSRLTLETVMTLRDWGEQEFIKRGFDAKIVMKAALLIEEIGMSIVDNNPNNQPLAELTLFFDEQPKIIIRDNGIHFDLTDELVTSFRSFFVYSLLDADEIANNYLTTQNYNRHVFCMA